MAEGLGLGSVRFRVVGCAQRIVPNQSVAEHPLLKISIACRESLSEACLREDIFSWSVGWLVDRLVRWLLGWLIGLLDGAYFVFRVLNHRHS